MALPWRRETVQQQDTADDGPPNPGRRQFLSMLSLTAMFGGLAVAYGTLAGIAGRFLYPARPRQVRWMYVAEVAQLRRGDSMRYRAPDGSHIAITRQGDGGSVDDFIALSSICPHLGCQVHWEGQKNRFFCPCHNGAFDPSGRATEGPPADAGQSLSRYPLMVKNGLLYVEVPVESIA